MKKHLPNILVIIRLIMALIAIVFLLMRISFPYSEYSNFYMVYDEITISYFELTSLFIFIIAAFTDWLDGYLARKWDVVSTFGKFFDPLADKILVNSVLIIFTVFGRIPVWITLIFIIRDFLVDGIRMQMASKGNTLAAQKYGKYKTFFQFIGLTLLFVVYSPTQNLGFNYNSIYGLSLIPLFIGMVFSVYSGYSYFLQFIKQSNI